MDLELRDKIAVCMILRLSNASEAAPSGLRERNGR